jgi:hypothetical protein
MKQHPNALAVKLLRALATSPHFAAIALAVVAAIVIEAVLA